MPPPSVPELFTFLLIYRTRARVQGIIPSCLPISNSHASALAGEGSGQPCELADTPTLAQPTLCDRKARHAPNQKTHECAPDGS